jgi:hypothetical protein
LIAVEVTELVCPEARSQVAQGRHVYRHWREGEILSRVNELLTTKDSKQFHGGPYAEKLVVIFTDELEITPDRVRQELATSSLGPFTQLTSAFLLFSYSPVGKNYEVVPIPLRRAV